MPGGARYPSQARGSAVLSPPSDDRAPGILGRQRELDYGDQPGYPLRTGSRSCAGTAVRGKIRSPAPVGLVRRLEKSSFSLPSTTRRCCRDCGVLPYLADLRVRPLCGPGWRREGPSAASWRQPGGRRVGESFAVPPHFLGLSAVRLLDVVSGPATASAWYPGWTCSTARPSISSRICRTPMRLHRMPSVDSRLPHRCRRCR